MCDPKFGEPCDVEGKVRPKVIDLIENRYVITGEPAHIFFTGLKKSLGGR